MRLTLIAGACAVMLVTSTSQTYSEDINCVEFCKSIAQLEPVDTMSWAETCDCISNGIDGVDTSFHTLGLDDSSIYFEPTEVYTLHRYSFISPPFYILNPTVQFRIDSEAPKNIKKRKLSHKNYAHRKNTHEDTLKINQSSDHKISLNKISLYLDVDVQNPGDFQRPVNSMVEPSITDSFELSEADFKECISIYTSDYFNSKKNTPLFLKIKDADSNTTEEKNFKADVIEKCSQPANVVKQSLQEIKSKWLNPKRNPHGLFKSTESNIPYHKSKAAVITTQNTMESKVLNSNKDDQPSLLEFRSHKKSNIHDLKTNAAKFTPNHDKEIEHRVTSEKQFYTKPAHTESTPMTESTLIKKHFQNNFIQNENISALIQNYNKDIKDNRNPQNFAALSTIRQATGRPYNTGQYEIFSNNQSGMENTFKNKTEFLNSKPFLFLNEEKVDTEKSSDRVSEEQFFKISESLDQDEFLTTTETFKNQNNQIFSPEPRFINTSEILNNEDIHLNTTQVVSGNGKDRNSYPIVDNSNDLYYFPTTEVTENDQLTKQNSLKNEKDRNNYHIYVNSNKEHEFNTEKMIGVKQKDSAETAGIESTTIFDFSDDLANTLLRITSPKKQFDFNTEKPISSVTTEYGRTTNSEYSYRSIRTLSALSASNYYNEDNTTSRENHYIIGADLSSNTLTLENSTAMTTTGEVEESFTSNYLNNPRHEIAQGKGEVSYTSTTEKQNNFMGKKHEHKSFDNTKKKLPDELQFSGNILVNTALNSDNITENGTNVEVLALPKILTKELYNGTAVSDLNGTEILHRDDLTHNNGKFLRAKHHKDQNSENVSTILTGRLFFVFDQQNIPARFVQKRNGELSVGIDGVSLCSDLNNKESGSILIKTLCNCLIHKKCTNPPK